MVPKNMAEAEGEPPPHGSQNPYLDDDGGPEPSASTSPQMHVQSGSAELGSSPLHLPLPVWLRESSKSFRWRWVPYRIRHLGRSIVHWTKDPDSPQLQKITPFFPAVQKAPLVFVQRFFPKRRHKAALLAFFYVSWIMTFSLLLAHSNAAGDIKGFGRPEPLWCGASYWYPGNHCDLNGNGCRPFGNATFAFRCPANCARVMVLNPHAVGDQEINYQQFVIGGPPAGQEIELPIYRGDSFICQAAIHAGVVSDEKGGCGVVQLAGEQSHFAASRQHGITSIGFDSYFPKSFTFLTSLSSHCIADLRWPLLAVTVSWTVILSLTTSSPLVFFTSVFPMLFFHVGLVSDPPSHSSLVSLTSIIVGRFLPAALGAFLIYRSSVRFQLAGLTAQIEKTILWLGGIWVGSLNNYTFNHIPIQRLTPHDLAVQPHARLALALIIILLLTIAAGQVYYLRLEGRLRRYLAIYGIFVAFLLVCVAIPPLHLRIHHYFLALLLLPGTRTQTRPGLLYQGILVGLFINGTARWGFDSILQTAAVLRGGDGQFGTLLPNITSPLAVGISNITFAWTTPPAGFDGLSVLVNDVERFRWYVGEGEGKETFDRRRPGEKEYFRFGYMQGSGAGDYTQAGVWEVDGTWTTMKTGPSFELSIDRRRGEGLLGGR